MNFTTILNQLLRGESLSFDTMETVIEKILTKELTPAQCAGFLIALRQKGESTEEITAAVTVMRKLSQRIALSNSPVVDTCGTGGDESSTFNISTISAFVVAAAGGIVAKHGNRSNSSHSGSADLLEAAGACITHTPSSVIKLISEVGVGFLFAQQYHPAMKEIAHIRKELGVRTLFNLLGPLINPANATHQLLGVFSQDWLLPLAKVLSRLGSEHALLVHSNDGLDEISLSDFTNIVELKNGNLFRYQITPEQFGFQRAPLRTLRVNSPEESLKKGLSALSGAPSPERDIVALNAGAAIYAADLEKSLNEGIASALLLLKNGSALHKWEQFLVRSREYAEPS